MSTPVVRKAQRSDTRPTAAVLAQAFDTDPFMRYVMPADDYRRRLTSLFAYEVAATPHGTWVAVDQGVIAGAMLWSPPGSSSQRAWPMLRHGADVIRAFGTSLPFAIRTFRHIDQAHPKSPPHWYLQTIGVAGSGRGIGGLLMRDALARVDATRAPAYLESSAPGNIPIYERYGFHVTGEIQLPGGGPTLTTMWRDVQA